MTAWNGKIRARNVLVGGGGIELASAEWAITAVSIDLASTLVTEL